MNRKHRRAEKKRKPAPTQMTATGTQDLLTEGLRHHQAGRLDEAERLYRRALAVDPGSADGLHLLGMIAHQAGRHDVAVDLIGKAATISPMVALYHSNLSSAQHDLGRLDDAVASLRQAVAIDPGLAMAHSNLGSILRELGRLDEAEASCLRALDLDSGLAEAHNNLGAALHLLGRLAEAEASCRRALAIDPDYAEAHSNLGAVLHRLGRLAEAEASCRRALEIRPDHIEARRNLGTSLLQQERLDEAVHQFQQVLLLDPGNTKVHLDLLNAIYRLNLVAPDQALVLALRLLATFPEDGVLRRGVGGIAGTDYSAEMEANYTTVLFDQFADEFEDVLGKLHYDIPQQLALAAGMNGGGAADLDILDAGCGTGLCGLHLKPRARRLVGVDLSANMLAKAGAKGLYDTLAQDDVVSFMAANPAGFDLVLAADVLIYIGDIVPLCRAAFAALRPGGVLAVSVESLEDEAGAPFVLSPSGRYRHRAAYLRESFALAGFTLDPLRNLSGRMESDHPVPCLIAVGRK